MASCDPERGSLTPPRTQFNLRFASPEQLARIKTRAAEVGLSTAEYLRRAAGDAAMFQAFIARKLAVQARYDRASLKLLERVGVNLNQVVRHMHREEFDGEIMESFRRILKTLEEILEP